MNITQEAKIHNKFKVVVQDANTKEIIQEAEAYNIVLTRFWEYFLSTSSSFVMNGIMLGDGDGTLSPERTTLFNQIVTKSYAETPIIEYNNTYASRTMHIVLTANEFNDIFFSEIGMGYSSHVNNPPHVLVTHAFFTDINGNKITIEKTSTKIITFYATTYITFPSYGTKSNKTTYTINGLNRSIIPSFDNINRWNPLIVLLRTLGTVNYDFPVSIQSKNIDLTNKMCTFICNRIDLEDCNDKNIRYVDVGFAIFDIQNPTPGELVSNEILGVGDGINTAYKLKYVFPQNLEIFLDGVLTNQYTIVNKPNDINNLFTLWYMENNVLKPFYNCGMQSGYLIYSSSSEWTYGYNTFNVQIKSLQRLSVSVDSHIEISEDGKNWIALTLGSYIHIPEEYYSYRWFRWKTTTNWIAYRVHEVVDERYNNRNNIYFNNPVPENVQITANYNTVAVLKDENHVLDLTFSVNFGEYTEGS